MALDDRYRTMPFDAAIEFLRDKIDLPTERWDDITASEHDSFFVIAGLKGSLLSDLRTAVDRAISEGWSQERFNERFRIITEGWAHRGGKDWRAEIVYRTNLRQSYAAGRYQQQLDPDVLALRPYLEYNHSDSINFRPSHKALDRQVFRAEDMPFYPPSGFGCACFVRSLSQSEFEARGGELSSYQRGDLVPYQDERGNQREVRVEPDAGFDYIPGQTRPEQRQQIIDQVLARLEPQTQTEVRQEVAQINERFSQPTDTSPNGLIELARRQLRQELEAVDAAIEAGNVLETQIGELQDQMVLLVEQIADAQRNNRGDKRLVKRLERLTGQQADLISQQRESARDAMQSLRDRLMAIGLDETAARERVRQVKIQQSATRQDTREFWQDTMTEFYQLTRGKAATKLKDIRKARGRSGNRAWASPDGQLNVGLKNSRGDRRRVLFHELGHFVEFADERLAEAARAWIRSKATGPLTSLRSLTGRNYASSEVAFPDDFVNPYVGKSYGENGPTEVVSMGLEHFVSPEKMLDLYRKDRDHFLLVLGMIRL
ncbi:MAG: phage minor head protein [Cyanobacteria bacterium P01_H01_bin.121]